MFELWTKMLPKCQTWNWDVCTNGRIHPLPWQKCKFCCRGHVDLCFPRCRRSRTRFILRNTLTTIVYWDNCRQTHDDDSLLCVVCVGLSVMWCGMVCGVSWWCVVLVSGVFFDCCCLLTWSFTNLLSPQILNAEGTQNARTQAPEIHSAETQTDCIDPLLNRNLQEVLPCAQQTAIHSEQGTACWILMSTNSVGSTI